MQPVIKLKKQTTQQYTLERKEQDCYTQQQYFGKEEERDIKKEQGKKERSINRNSKNEQQQTRQTNVMVPNPGIEMLGRIKYFVR